MQCKYIEKKATSIDSTIFVYYWYSFISFRQEAIMWLLPNDVALVPAAVLADDTDY